jgi:hypothetical protein
MNLREGSRRLALLAGTLAGALGLYLSAELVMIGGDQHWLWLEIPALPVLGFALGWGAVRLTAWVILGFITKP